ncbi:MAG: DUF3987 domain-containing protein, partial [Planctomycetaceae bacterium]|nr:DUF3987 domain-containing protein [Planctomycetaceae bacterium]
MSLVQEFAENYDRSARRNGSSPEQQDSELSEPQQEPTLPRIPFRPFPADCLPDVLSLYVNLCAQSIGCDPSMVAVPLLAVLAAAIGGSRIVEIRRGFTQPAILWTAIIAQSGAGKSPAFRAAVMPFYRIEESIHELHASECERILQAFENMPGPKSKKGNSEPEYPPLPRCCISDATIEAVCQVLKQNPDGVLLSVDELSGWFSGMNQYKGGRGADRSHWLRLYDADQLRIDRKTGPIPHLFIPKGIVSITGGIQPGVLRRALSVDDFDSGLPARFVFTM